jgi:hypothetical protein
MVLKEESQMEDKKQQTALFQAIGKFAAIIILLVISGCSDSSNDPGSQEPKVELPGFTASVSGAVNAELSGSGIVTYLGPKERDIVTGNRPGYFLIASINPDGNANKQFSILFRIPDAAQPGNYNLVTPDPLKVGENFDVRVETLEEGKLIAYQMNTEGTLILDNFSPDRTYPSISNISGTFQFVTENSEGDQISANGTFDFPVGEKVVFQSSIYSFKELSGV